MKLYILVFVIYSILEYWLGKTDLVKENSLLALLKRIILGVGAIIFRTKKL